MSEVKISEQGATITMNQDELQKLIDKAVAKKVASTVGSGSVKSKSKEGPKLDISKPGNLEALMEACGHKLSTTFLQSGYDPQRYSEKKDGNVGGYAFVQSTEARGFKQPQAVWIKTAGSSGMIDLDGITDALAKIRTKLEISKQATEALADYEKGLEALFNSMIENEERG